VFASLRRVGRWAEGESFQSVEQDHAAGALIRQLSVDRNAESTN
jgi:hypothetical protein